MPERIRHENDDDHGIWMRCYEAALAGMSDRASSAKDIARAAAEIAAAALQQKKQRRHDPSHQAFTAGRR